MNTKHCLCSLLLVVPMLAMAKDNIGYSLRFSNNSNSGDMSLALSTTEGVALVDGITTINPISLPSGRSKEVKFLIQGLTTSWRMQFTVCKNSLLAANNSKCSPDAESICQFDASGVGDLPFYSSNAQSNQFKCSPGAAANQQHVNFSVTND